jgi:hypothetical protein
MRPFSHPHERKELSLRTHGVAVSAASGDASVTTRVLTMLMHQFLATFGVLVWALVLTSFVLGIPRIWGRFFFMSDVRGALTAAPNYTVQIIVGLLWGWLVWTGLQHRAMLWVWVFPLITLVLGMLDNSTRTSSVFPGAVISNIRPMLSRFFGSGCRTEDHCFSQIGMTLPFYASVSYALGAWLALRFPIRSRALRRIVYWTVIIIGVLILADMILGVKRDFTQWSWWMILLAGTFEAAMGVCLIFFGVRMRRMDNQPTPSPTFSE